jgi:hypothetical protein
VGKIQRHKILASCHRLSRFLHRVHFSFVLNFHVRHIVLQQLLPLFFIMSP